MRTETVTMASCRPPREPSPRRFVRPGVTRMVRSTAIPLLILAGMALTPTEANLGINYLQHRGNLPAAPERIHGCRDDNNQRNHRHDTTPPPTSPHGTSQYCWEAPRSRHSPRQIPPIWLGSFDATSTTISVASPLDVILIANLVHNIHYMGERVTNRPVHRIQSTIRRNRSMGFEHHRHPPRPSQAVPEPSSRGPHGE